MFTWESNVSLADHLATMPISDMIDDPETYYRASVGRAYYACHKSVHDWMEGNTQYNPTQNGSIHTHVIHNLRTFMSLPEAAIIERKLDDLRLHRIQADYTLIPTIAWTKTRATNSVSQARDIISKLSTATPSI